MAETTKKKFDGKFIIPIALFVAAAYSAYRAIAAMNSGSTKQTPDGIVDAGNVGWFETGGGWFCLGFAVVGAIVLYLMNREK